MCDHLSEKYKLELKLFQNVLEKYQEEYLVQQDANIVDQSDTWTEQDQLDIVGFSLQYATTGYPENEELAE